MNRPDWTLPIIINDEPDAWGNAGEQCDCMTCDGSGMEYGETCVTCGWIGWVNQPIEGTGDE